MVVITAMNPDTVACVFDFKMLDVEPHPSTSETHSLLQCHIQYTSLLKQMFKVGMKSQISDADGIGNLFRVRLTFLCVW